MQFELYNLTRENIWSNPFLSFMVGNFDLKSRHVVRSISAAILNDGIVRPNARFRPMAHLRKAVLKGGRDVYNLVSSNLYKL